MSKSLDALAWAWIAGIALMAVTGGGVIPLERGKIELSQLNAWVLALGLISALRFFADRGSFALAPLPRVLSGSIDRLAGSLRPWRTTFAMLAAGALILTTVHVFRFLSFHTTLFDQGVIHQTLFNIASGLPFACDTCVSGSYLAEHLAFTLALVAPFSLLGHEAIIVLQSLIMAAALALILRGGPTADLPRRAPLALLVFFCHPALRNSWIWDFREDHLAFLFLSAQAIAAYRGNLAWLALWTIPALLTKENIAFIQPFLYLAFWIRHRRGALPLLGLSLVCLAWIAVTFKLLVPHFSGGVQGAHEIVSRFGGLGSSPGEVLTHLLVNPLSTVQLIFQKLLTPIGLRYLLALLGPVIVLSWGRSSVWLIAAAPGILMNLVSGADTQRSMGFHYELVILPFLLLVMIEGVRDAGRKRLMFALFFALAFSGRWPGLHLRANIPSATQIDQHSWLRESIPANGPLGVDNRLYGSTSLRTDTRSVGFPPTATDWDGFVAANPGDRTGLPNRTPESLGYLLLDLSNPFQSILASRMPPSWAEAARDPSGRLVLFKRR